MRQTLDKPTAVTHTGPVTTSRTVSDEGAATAEDLRRCAGGDSDALARLYDATAARVYGLVLRTLGDPVRAQEVTRQTYLDVWSQAHRYDPARGSASTWITGLAHRRVLAGVRSAAGPGPAATGAATSTVLSREQARALDLTYFGGATCGQAAEVLDVPVGAVRDLLRHGLRRLRDSADPQKIA